MAEDEKVTEEVTESTTSEDSKATEEKVVESSKEGKESSIPPSRLKEVVDERDTFKTRYEDLEKKFGEEQEKVGKMIDLVETREEDTKLVAAIRQLAASDPKYMSLVETLDKGLQGKDEEPEDKGDETKTGDDTAKLIKETRESLEEKIVDQQNEHLMDKANYIADKYFDALPEQYTEQDKKICSEMLTERVDWDSIEGNNELLSEKIASAFEKTLEDFGQPRGTVAEEKTKETETTTETKEAPKEELPEDVTKNWGEMKPVTLPDGKTKLQPVHTEDDFKDALARVLRSEDFV